MRGLLLLGLLFAGCASTAEVTRGAGDRLSDAQALPLHARPRIAVGAILDKTQGQLLAEINLAAPGEQNSVSGLTQGLHDLLVTELFASQRFIVLERDALNDVISEQEFARSAKVGDATRIAPAQLEGADYIVLGALTAFDSGAGGGALPIPIPLSERGDFGILNIRAQRGHVAMDLRVIAVKTGRVVHSTAVEGRNWRMGLDLTGFFRAGRSSVRLPGLLTLFSNTPVEEALQKMVKAAGARITDACR